MRQPEDTMSERSDDPTWKLWFLLNANRWVVTVVLMVGVFVTLVVVAVVSPVALRELMAAGEPVQAAFQALTTALITGVTLVVTINQLVLSQELGAVDDQRERLAGSMEFRNDVEGVIDGPIAPPEPASFLQAIVDATGDHALEFREAVGGSHDQQLRERVDDFVGNLTSHADTVCSELEGAEFGTYEVLEPVLDYNYSWKIFRARRIESEHAEEFSEGAHETFDTVLESLELFGLAREHFKTLYFQWELINLSRAMMYVAVPALVVTTSMLLFFDAGIATGATLGVDHLVWVVAGGVTIAVTPFLLLIAFVLRIATIAKRTLAIGPFILRKSSRDEEGD